MDNDLLIKYENKKKKLKKITQKKKELIDFNEKNKIPAKVFMIALVFLIPALIGLKMYLTLIIQITDNELGSIVFSLWFFISLMFFEEGIKDLKDAEKRVDEIISGDKSVFKKMLASLLSSVFVGVYSLVRIGHLSLDYIQHIQDSSKDKKKGKFTDEYRISIFKEEQMVIKEIDEVKKKIFEDPSLIEKILNKPNQGSNEELVLLGEEFIKTVGINNMAIEYAQSIKNKQNNIVVE